MLTPDQEDWIAHLSDTSVVTIAPFDSSSVEKFEKVRAKIHAALGTNVPVEHHGSTLLGIAGQDELDVYVPVPSERFGEFVTLLTSLFGEPHSHYPLMRARFVTEEFDKHIDVFVINKEHESSKVCLQFEQYLLTHPDALEEYRVLKEQAAGQSMREYYRRKIEFINDIVTRAV